MEETHWSSETFLNNYETEISVQDLYNFWIRRTLPLVHCGAHLAEELEEYESVGWNEITWIEANYNLIPALADRLRAHHLSEILNATLWSKAGEELTLKIANNSYSSSILDFGTHAQTYPDISFEGEIQVQSVTLDLLLENRKNFNGGLLVLDLQGVELEVLMGSSHALKLFDYIYTEVSKSNLYEGQGNWSAISEYLTKHDFKLVDWQYSTRLNCGNALYQRNGKTLFALKQRYQRKIHHFLLQKFNRYLK